MRHEQAVRLEQLLREFDRVGVARQVGFERLHLYSIITHSTAIEGSTITLEENALMLGDGILPSGRQVHEQMMNLDLMPAYQVMEEVAKAGTRLSLPLLTAFSSLVMKNTGVLYHTANGTYDEAKGEFRLQDVSAGRGGRSYLSWEKVEERATDFVAWLNEELAGVDELSPAEVYDLSFEAHFRLVTIHPWSDGNGRAARLVMNLVQVEGDVVPSYVRNERKAAYIRALQAAQDAGTSSPFAEFMAQETIDILAQDIEEYTRDRARDVPWREAARGISRHDATRNVSRQEAVRDSPQSGALGDVPKQGAAQDVPKQEAVRGVPQLGTALDDVTPQVTPVTPQVTPVTPQVTSLLKALDGGALSASELRTRLGLSDAKSFRALYLRKAMDAGLVEMTMPDKPRSSRQRYRLTESGATTLAALGA